MSTGPPKLARREHAIDAARRRLKRLEIETHRIKAALARLEADYEEDVANWLTRTLRRRTLPARDDDPDRAYAANPRPSTAKGTTELGAAPRCASSAGTSTLWTEPDVLRAPLVLRASDPTNADHKAARHLALPRIAADLANLMSTAPKTNSGRAARNRQSTRPLLVSFGIHAVVLLLSASFTFATLINRGIPLFASPTVFDDLPVQLGEVEITSHKFADQKLENVVSDSDAFNVSDKLLRDFDPAQIGAGAEPLGDMGQLDMLPGELGELLAGAGQPGRGPNGGPLGSAVFFGAQSKGNRFVYVVDNSSSMKGGRLETAIAELLNSVDALTPRQSFYVIFVSDQTYPMFYPTPATTLVPATAPNKKQLTAWLPKAILASGKNRELITAMDLAASLQPHAVFLLWDGDMKYSDKVRMDVMTHLTRPNHWNFAIHTLGFGITSLDSEANLTAIAHAHGGTFRKIDVPKLPPR